MANNRFLHRGNGSSSIHPAPNRRNFFAGNYQIIGVTACTVASGLAYKSFGMKKVDAKISKTEAREAQMHIDLGRKEQKMAEILKKFSKENKELATEIKNDAARTLNANNGKTHMSLVGEFEARLTPEQRESLAREKSFEEMMNQLRSQDKEIQIFEQIVRESKEAKDEKFWVYAKMWGVGLSSMIFFFLVF